MSRLFRFKKQKEETWIDYYARACRTARKIWVQMGLPFLYEVIAESMWRARGWVWDGKANAVINTLKSVFRWRSTRKWQSTQARMMEEDPCNHTRWKHKWRWHNRGTFWDKMATDWAGKEDWMSKRKMCTR